MYYFFVVLHVVACVGLILVVLMQSGKGGGLSGLTGGGSSGGEQLFGAAAGISFIKKVTVGFVLVPCSIKAWLKLGNQPVSNGSAFGTRTAISNC
jgi:protein translocase SecG subunit